FFQLNQLVYKKNGFVQIFNWRTFILESSNILQCTDPVKAPSFFRAELFLCKTNHINTASEIMCRFVNIVTQSQTPPVSSFRVHQQFVLPLLHSDNVCRS